MDIETAAWQQSKTIIWKGHHEGKKASDRAIHLYFTTNDGCTRDIREDSDQEGAIALLSILSLVLSHSRYSYLLDVCLRV